MTGITTLKCVCVSQYVFLVEVYHLYGEHWPLCPSCRVHDDEVMRGVMAISGGAYCPFTLANSLHCLCDEQSALKWTTRSLLAPQLKMYIKQLTSSVIHIAVQWSFKNKHLPISIK